MKVLKFGGTSVGTAERIRSLSSIIPTSEPTIVVLSAMAGVTNKLVESLALAQKGKNDMAMELIKGVEKMHLSTCNNLFSSKYYKQMGMDLVKKIVGETILKVEKLDNSYDKEVLSIGEILSANLLHLFLSERNFNVALIPSISFMRVDKDGMPDYYYITEKLTDLLESCRGIDTIITQGFICKNAKGDIDNLGRGGSDFSAAIIGNAINASEVQIWTDIDGLHNNDPRHVDGTQPIRELSFDEAAELAYFGAKILHPSSIHPCREKNIPVVLKNTLNPTDEGTLIASSTSKSGIKAVAAKDGITAIRINSLRMLMAHGFMKNVFEVFDIYKTPVDLITTSEVAVTVTIDNTSNINSIVKALRAFSTVEVVQNQTIICVVGDFLAEKRGMAFSVFKCLEHIPLRQISYGGSSHNITLLINSKDKESALYELHSIVSNSLNPVTENHGNTIL